MTLLENKGSKKLILGTFYLCACLLSIFSGLGPSGKVIALLAVGVVLAGLMWVSERLGIDSKS